MNLGNNTCESPTLSQPDNCLVYQSASACQLCEDTYVPNANGVCEKHNVANCSIYDQVQKQCVLCIKDHYYDATAKTCKPASPVIPGCDEYLNNTQCKRCSSSQILTLNKLCEPKSGAHDVNCDQ